MRPLSTAVLAAVLLFVVVFPAPAPRGEFRLIFNCLSTAAFEGNIGPVYLHDCWQTAAIAERAGQ